MNEERFEKMFRDRLAGEELDVNLDQMWEGVSSELHPRKKRRVGLLLLLLLPIGLFSVLAWDHFTDTNENLTAEVEEPIASVQKKQDLNIKVINKDVNEQSSHIAKNGVGQLNKDAEDENESITKPILSKNSNLKSSGNPALNRRFNAVTLIQEANESSIVNLGDNAQLVSKVEKENENVFALNKHSENLIPELWQLSVNLKTITIKGEIEQPLPGIMPSKTIIADSRNSKFNSIYINSEIYAPFRSLNSNDEWLQIREKSERPLEMWGVNIGYEKKMSSKWSLFAEFGVRQLAEEMSFQSIKTEKSVLENVLIREIFKSDGTVEQVFGDVMVDRTLMRSQTRYNEYRSYAILAGVNYLHSIGPKLEFVIGAGLNMGMAHEYSGYILNEEGEMYDLAKDNKALFKTGPIYSAMIKAGLRYNISPNWGVSLGVSGIANLNSINNEQNPIDQKYIFTGGATGIYFKF